MSALTGFLYLCALLASLLGFATLLILLLIQHSAKSQAVLKPPEPDEHDPFQAERPTLPPDFAPAPAPKPYSPLGGDMEDVTPEQVAAALNRIELKRKSSITLEITTK